jgi:tetratricopeptide (TPR) repeat protein
MSKNNKTTDLLSPARQRVSLISGVVFGVGILVLIGFLIFNRNGSNPSAKPGELSGNNNSTEQFRVQKDMPVADASAPRQGKRAGDARSEVMLSKDELTARNITEGNKLMMQGKYNEAYSCYQKILDDNPKSEDAHFNMGILLARMKKTTEAVQHYEEAIKIMPDYTEAHNNLGNLLVSIGKYEDAIAHFKEALRIMPDHAAAHNNMGNAFARQGMSMQATDYFLKAIKLKPDYVEAHFNLATAYAAMNRPEDAVKEFQEVLLLRPGFEPAVKALERLNIPKKQ